MKKALICAGPLFMLVAAFAFTRSPIPEIDYTYEGEGSTVAISFTVNKFSAKGLELASDKGDFAPFFMQFGVAMKGGRPVVTLTGVSSESAYRGSKSTAKLPDFPFFRDDEGSPVLQFNFEGQLAKDAKGKQAMRMTYLDGRVPFVETFVVTEPQTLPADFSKAIGTKGLLQFQPGTYYLDQKIDGFWVPYKDAN